MHPMLTIAVKAARRAGNIINRGARDLDRLTVTAKGPKDFVSEVDRAAEAAIVDIIHATYPDHAILAEEGTAQGANASAEHVWIIDPLDGTTNFLHGFPQYCVSDRAATQGTDHAGRGLRSGAQRPVHRDARARRVSERSPHARVAPAASEGLPDRHRLPVSRRQRPRCLRENDALDDGRDRRIAASRRGRAGPRLRRRRLHGRFLGSRPQCLGRRRRQPADSSRPAAWSAISKAKPTICTVDRSSRGIHGSSRKWSTLLAPHRSALEAARAGENLRFVARQPRRLPGYRLWSKCSIRRANRADQACANGMTIPLSLCTIAARSTVGAARRGERIALPGELHVATFATTV